MSDIKKTTLHVYDESTKTFKIVHPETETSQIPDLDAYIEKAMAANDDSSIHESLQNSINTKQDKLTFDKTPKDGSTNPVTSDGVKSYVDSLSDSVWHNSKKLICTVNLNNITKEGIYYQDEYMLNGVTLNYPLNVGMGTLLVFKTPKSQSWYNDGYIQLFYPKLQNNCYQRSYFSSQNGDISGTWTSWASMKSADTAIKLATARNISLTGDVSGSVTFDGSEDVNISTTVNESKHAAASDSATVAVSDGNGNVIVDTYATKTALSTKQEKLVFDTTPTADSQNPVTSDGIKKAIDAKTVDLSNYYTKTQVDTTIKTIQNSINTKQDELTFDETPTIDSSNPVTSDGIKKAIDGAVKNSIKYEGGAPTGVIKAGKIISPSEKYQFNPPTPGIVLEESGSNIKYGSVDIRALGEGNGKISFSFYEQGGPQLSSYTLDESGNFSGNAATATKATQDASGNVITDTYATKTEISNSKVAAGSISSTDGTIAVLDGAGNKLTFSGNLRDYCLQNATSYSPDTSGIVTLKSVNAYDSTKVNSTKITNVALKTVQDSQGTSISTLQSNVSSLQTTVNSNKSRLDADEKTIAGHTTTISTLATQSALNAHMGDANAHSNRLSVTTTSTEPSLATNGLWFHVTSDTGIESSGGTASLSNFLDGCTETAIQALWT